MISQTDPEFWRLFYKLPKEIQIAARKAFEKFSTNPDHPSLNFKPLRGDSDFFSARVSLKYRVVGPAPWKYYRLVLDRQPFRFR